MKKILCLLLSILLLGNIYAADVFEEGAGADVISGGDSPSDIDTLLDAALTEPLGRLLQEYRIGAKIAYSSATTITVASGQIALQNATGAIIAFLDNTSSTSVTFANIDTGSEAASTTYYVYGYCTTPASDTDFDITISTSSSAPSGKTYYARLGSFYNDSSSNIDSTTIVNDNDSDTKIKYIYNYGSSASSYASVGEGDFIVCYGYITVAGSQVISNLPFTSATTYSVTTTQNATSDNYHASVQRNSGSQMTLYKSNSHPYLWKAIGY